jgi:hypothetical protein
MSDSDSNLPAPVASDPLLEVEVLPPGRTDAGGQGVVLAGEAGRSAIDGLGSLVALGAGVGQRSNQVTYRLVAPGQAGAGLADGSLRWATASRGDASVLVKDSATGRIAHHGQLHQVRPSPAKVLGPAVWEAMAMATQQHFLVEIDAKLQTIERGVNESLQRLDDDKRGALNQARKLAHDVASLTARGEAVSATRRGELSRATERVDVVWHQLHERARRHLAAYRAGGDTTAADVEASWELLLRATQALAECGAALTALPYATVEELQDATEEEHRRIGAAVQEVRSMAGELHAAHGDWSAQRAEWLYSRTRNPVTHAKRKVKRTSIAKPAQEPLPAFTAWHCGVLAVPPKPPTALLATVNEDGTVVVSAESPKSRQLPAAE